MILKKNVSQNVLELAYSIFIEQVFNDKESVQIETQIYYRSPFTDKFVKSIWDIIKNAVPRCIQIGQEQIEFQERMTIKKEEEKAEIERQRKLRDLHPKNYKI